MSVRRVAHLGPLSARLYWNDTEKPAFFTFDPLSGGEQGLEDGLAHSGDRLPQEGRLGCGGPRRRCSRAGWLILRRLSEQPDAGLPSGQASAHSISIRAPEPKARDLFRVRPGIRGREEPVFLG